MKKKGTVFCDYCERAYLPEVSTAENKSIYCSQACENSDGLEDSEESEDE
jgi:hypothetical protein